MEKVLVLLDQHLTEQLLHIILSDARRKDGVFKVKVRPVMTRDGLRFQFTSYIGTKVFHENLEKQAAKEKIEGLLQNDLRQMQLLAEEASASALVSKKGHVTLKTKKRYAADTGEGIKTENRKISLGHNRQKKYLLPEGEIVPFLVDLGVQTKEGGIVRSKYDKYRQINRFLEFIEDIAKELPKERTISILDFGCGKSYLTFAMYYYLKIKKHYDIEVTGLDLKEDVISSCNALAVKYGYDHLSFIQGDIKDYQKKQQVDMVVTLHACDTATDYALFKAVKWNAKVILSVPCCQHEINQQIKNDLLSPILKYGLLKERMSALLTDGIRANLLEELGYQTQVLEFIDLEHTPKNVLIRAVRSDKMKKRSGEEISRLLEQFHTQQTLATLLGAGQKADET